MTKSICFDNIASFLNNEYKMTISTFSDLKRNEHFMLLNQKQSQYDTEDSNTLNDRFTRSPVHAVQFLIAYAALDEEQQNQVVANLNINLTKSDLDALIADIDWVALLRSNFQEQETLQFEFTIGITDKKRFLDAARVKCPALYRALENTDHSFVRIESCDEVKFTTKIVQNELWERAFLREAGENFWSVGDFRISSALQESLDLLGEGEKRIINGFTLKKGTGSEAQRIELRIAAPRQSNQYSISSELQTNNGIYAAFVGLNNFYGLSQVDEVVVEIRNEAKFSDEGASASQTQVNTYVQECASLPPANIPSIIEVKELNVFL